MIRAEARRVWGSPAYLFTLLIGVVVPSAMAFMTSIQIRRNLDGGRPGAFVDTSLLGFGEVYGLLPCAMVLGVLAVAPELAPGVAKRGSGCERLTVHLAVPRRFHTLTVGVLVMLSAVAVSGLTLLVSHVVALRVLGSAPDWGPDAPQRAAALMATWAVIALLSSTLAWISRSIVIPLVILVAGSSLAPVSYLLSLVTPLARYLPDVAGAGIAVRGIGVEPLPAPTAFVTLALWAVAALIVSAEVAARRDS